jgi:hypothetical protein
MGVAFDRIVGVVDTASDFQSGRNVVGSVTLYITVPS